MKNDKTKPDERVQFNTRISPTLKRAAKTVAAYLDWTIDDVDALAVAVLLGANGEMIEKKKKVEQAVRKLNLTFNVPDRQFDRDQELIAA